MNTARIKEIQQGTVYPESVSVMDALFKVWNECKQEEIDCNECEFESTITDETPCILCSNNYMNRFKPKPVIKKIGLYPIIKSGIDVEVSKDNETWKVTQLTNVTQACDVRKYANHLRNWYPYCRIRENYWHSWNGGDCPLPEGLNIIVKFRGGTNSIENMTYHNVDNWNHNNRMPQVDVIAFKVIGPAKGYEY